MQEKEDLWEILNIKMELNQQQEDLKILLKLVMNLKKIFPNIIIRFLKF